VVTPASRHRLEEEADNLALERLDPQLVSSPGTCLGILGPTGVAAFYAVQHVAKPAAGETVLVTGATGAVGSVVSQICKLLGCKVIVTTHSSHKVAYLESIGFDGIARVSSHLGANTAAIKAICPEGGVDRLIDTVGGEVLDSVLPNIRIGGRILSIGMSSQEGLPVEGKHALKNTAFIMERKLHWEGYQSEDFVLHREAALRNLTVWLRNGDIKQGFETTLTGFLKGPPAGVKAVLEGTQCGKAVVKVEADDHAPPLSTPTFEAAWHPTEKKEVPAPSPVAPPPQRGHGAIHYG